MSENIEYMGAIAKGIFGSDDLRKADWNQVSIVFEVDAARV
ncbi:hypothetical protein [Rhizobium tumorigenes]|uniref:Uncharacterized protein n=1 Tax=Rhizobium tumorigenes TaxID=2041385 RepID=A0AAF1KX18_9HYPH|nr:hypothetical protein [Rhizobium tumorigenes]WFR98769.1 hypothetical protein PR017_24025 [Rhizobium tumorigenes]